MLRPWMQRPMAEFMEKLKTDSHQPPTGQACKTRFGLGKGTTPEHREINSERCSLLKICCPKSMMF